MNKKNCPEEYDFALVIDGVPELTTEVENALFEAGCDDATFSIQYGHLFAEFSRTEVSLKDAILSAIQNVRKAGIGAVILSVDQCNLVTQSDIAHRIGRSRQMVYQYITGQRGPGNFPPPECHIAEGSPLWSWCTVSYWLAQNDIIRPEERQEAEVIAAINNSLEAARLQERDPELVREIAESVKPSRR